MDITELLNSSLGQSIIQNVASQFGLDQKEASGAVSAAIPTILAGMTKNAQSKEGAESLNRAIESKHDGSLLDNLSGILQGHTHELQQDGDGILGHVFGNKRSAVEQGISNKTGVSSSKIGPLLSTLAPIVMAYLGKEKRQTSTNAGGLGDLLGGLMGGAKQSRSGGGIMDLISGALDKDGDGDAMDDILDMFSKKR
ncbi:MAG TPA: hypothetical protein DEB12_07035 [Porphyromonadaceae bacterium]|nr:hypothetical protein [Porphyromonadaceae bacterium]